MWYCQSALEIQKKSKSEWTTVFRKKYLVVGTWKMENLN